MPRSKEFTISIALRAIDKVTAPLSKMNSAFKSANSRLRSDAIHKVKNPSIFAKLGLEARRLKMSLAEFGSASGISEAMRSASMSTVKFKKALVSVRRTARSVLSLFLRLSLIAGAAGFGLFAMMNKYIQQADAIPRMARLFGMSSESLKGWRLSAQSVGVEAEKLNIIIRRLANTQARAAWGIPTDNLNLYNAGISNVRKGKKLKSIEDLLFEMSDRVSNPKLPQQKKLALLKPIFGRQEYDALALLGDGKAALKSRMNEMRAVGFNPSKDDEKKAQKLRYSLILAQQSMEAMSATIMSEASPVLSQLFKEFSEFWRDNREGVKTFARDFAKKLPGVLYAIKDIMLGLGQAIKPLLDLFSSLSDRFGTANVAAGVFYGYLGFKIIPSTLGLSFGVLKLVFNLTKIGLALTSVTSLMGVFSGVARICGTTILAGFFAPWFGGITALAGTGSIIVGFGKLLMSVFGIIRVQAVSALAFVNPWIAGAMALGAAGIYIYKHWEPIKNLFSYINDSISSFFGLTSKPQAEYLDNSSHLDNFKSSSRSSTSTASADMNKLIQGIYAQSSKASEKSKDSNQTNEQLLKNLSLTSPNPGKIVLEFVNAPRNLKLSENSSWMQVNFRQGLSFGEVN